MNITRYLRFLTLMVFLAPHVACSSVGRVLNPFYEEPPPEAYLGEKNDRAISGGKQKTEEARQALEAMASYRRAQEPRPTNPVIYPAVVRLMWIPDHLNKYNDLVPEHYYYLRVLDDRPAVTDSFELMEQLNVSGDKTGNVPFVHADEASQ
ncbi:MAG: hypothetical protein J5J00_16640 [Deltaproteobacteria bacterium]|nr:hypothetical protein [Deltaproteobacteria bacterium]